MREAYFCALCFDAKRTHKAFCSATNWKQMECNLLRRTTRSPSNTGRTKGERLCDEQIYWHAAACGGCCELGEIMLYVIYVTAANHKSFASSRSYSVLNTRGLQMNTWDDNKLEINWVNSWESELVEWSSWLNDEISELPKTDETFAAER